MTNIRNLISPYVRSELPAMTRTDFDKLRG